MRFSLKLYDVVPENPPKSTYPGIYPGFIEILRESSGFYDSKGLSILQGGRTAYSRTITLDADVLPSIGEEISVVTRPVDPSRFDMKIRFKAKVFDIHKTYSPIGSNVYVEAEIIDAVVSKVSDSYSEYH